MDFRLTDDQRALVGALRDLLAARFDRTALRAAVDAAEAEGGTATPPRDIWRALGETGFFGLRLPEADGGVGLGLPEAALLFEEAGSALVPGPLTATHLAAGAVPGAATGEAVVTLLDARVAGPHSVAHLDAADAVLVLTADRETAEVTVAEASAVRRRAEPLRSVDPLTPLHLLTMADISEITLNGTVPARAVALRREAAVLEAAQRVGSAGRMVRMAVQHAREREQFGRPIGSFQAVKHLCAEMLVRAELARTALYAAAVTADPYETAAARLLADEAATRNARDCLQVFGGMGFTWEADVQLHIKRSWIPSVCGQESAADEDMLAEWLL
ncbi:acyl-CoA dehydrogenase family protein [Streptomyces sp. CBMA29]|uniref:acyl-CoA dehydrogenase family protein n=1 Tax=Streptomyces sp. CBMA29 TaxID=1896314 RepID=UPI0016619BCB|nr:acyl-CoA dehydrogenase family protein [Streptomyces sp. CBMA29]MBD0734623.1 acyl-CoA dehydrogenase [Streptomyces sp. CBMA29]